MMLKPSEWIALPWADQYMTFERDKLQTAVLVYLEAQEARYTYPSILTVVSVELRDEYGFTRPESLLYPVAAKICIDREIEP